MFIQIASDLHLEAYHDPAMVWKFITPQADTIVLAGDIDAHRFEESLSEIATRFKTVIALYGNHEFYNKDIAWLPDATKMPDNVFILNPGIHEHEDVVFIGATLWTDFKNQDWFVMHRANEHINDFHIITNGNREDGTFLRFTPQAAVERHLREKAYIKMMIEKYRGRKIVIVTHFLPTYQVVHEKWKTNSGTDTLLNYYFTAQCDDLIEMCEAKAWIFGHTHDFRDLEVNGIRMIANPLGYPRENAVFNDFILEI